jgi:hypothetical protein
MTVALIGSACAYLIAHHDVNPEMSSLLVGHSEPVDVFLYELIVALVLV